MEKNMVAKTHTQILISNFERRRDLIHGRKQR